MTERNWQDHAIKVGSVVTVAGFKTQAVVLKDLNKIHTVNKWHGWVELDRPLNGFLRWHRDELERVK